MRGYRPTDYGERLAEVYDEWFGDIGDPPALVGLLSELVAPPARLCELAVGTGRLAIPLAAAGYDVTGIDNSAAMLERLAAHDDGDTVTAIRDDMVDGLRAAATPFDLVVVAYNSLFLLDSPERQQACFAAAADALSPAGQFVVEAFVPDEHDSAVDEPPRRRNLELRHLTVDRVVLAADVTDRDAQTVDGQFVELVDGEPVRLRPYRLRYSTVAELDGFAAAAGLTLVERFGDENRRRFDAECSHHLSVYGLG